MSQTAAVIGMGKSGKAATALLRARGYEVATYDEKDGPLPSPIPPCDFVVLSPGVPRSKVQSTSPVIGEIELAWRMLPKGAGPILGITGTNGKSTTTALAGALFHRDRRAFVGGNLGTPLSELLLARRAVDVAVVELSSFQLEGIDRLRPAVAACLNVTPDHLDRYRDVEDYALAKARIFRNQQAGDHAVANARDGRALAMAGASRGALHTFGFGRPSPGHARADEAAQELWLGDERYAVRGRALRGRHNLENAMAAALCARLLGVPAGEVQAGLDEFPGLPHRLEVVRERRGVEWVNDSKATNVDSTQVALQAFAKGRPRIVLVLGGRGKGAPYAPLVPLLDGRVKAVLTIGEDAPAVERELAGAVALERAGTLAEAVARAAAATAEGDVVLLSPACASYDQFRNYEERGEAFRRLVGELA